MNPASTTDVAIIIVGLNAQVYVRKCLEALLSAPWRNHTFQFIYVDNGSTDNTLTMLRESFSDVTVIANSSNLGFCKAANQGARLAGSRYLCFLNDDTVTLDDAVALLAEFLDQTSEAGAVGGRLLYPDFSEQWSGRRFPSPANLLFGRRSWLSRMLPNARPLVNYLYRDQLNGGEPFRVDWVSAAALMVRKETFQEMGGFAEDFYYWHEVIFCDRVRKTGKIVFLHPRAKLIHHEGKGSGHRPYRVRKWHVLDFHRGAYRCYCEHYQLARWNPLRWLAAFVLGTRACALLTANRIASLKEHA